jgi:uncharacterized membrane protein YdbT with pleckstrin-like domain
VSEIDDKLISGEQVVLRTTKHWAAPIADSKWAILMVVGALALAWIQPDNSDGLFGFISRIIELFKLGLFLGGLGWIAYNIVAWRTAEYHVTNRRVLGHDGLVRSRSTDTLLMSIADVRTTISAFGRMLGYGNIKIISASGEAGADSFTTVRGIDAFKTEILEQKAGAPAMAAAAPAAAAPPTAAPASAPNPTATLAELAKLRDAGAISPEDYEAKKTELLGRI